MSRPHENSAPPRLRVSRPPENSAPPRPRVRQHGSAEQNFTYIAALKPKMAIITDIRRGNLQPQLMYKALFEMATDRPDFVGRLFSKKRPEGLTRAAAFPAGDWRVTTGQCCLM